MEGGAFLASSKLLAPESDQQLFKKKTWLKSTSVPSLLTASVEKAQAPSGPHALQWIDQGSWRSSEPSADCHEGRKLLCVV